MLSLPAKALLGVLGTGTLATGGVFTYQHFFSGDQKSSEEGGQQAQGQTPRTPVNNAGQTGNTSAQTQPGTGESTPAGSTTPTSPGASGTQATDTGG